MLKEREIISGSKLRMQIDLNDFEYQRVNVFVMRIKEGYPYIDTHDCPFPNSPNCTRITNENMEEMVDILNNKYRNRAFKLDENRRDAEIEFAEKVMFKTKESMNNFKDTTDMLMSIRVPAFERDSKVLIKIYAEHNNMAVIRYSWMNVIGNCEPDHYKDYSNHTNDTISTNYTDYYNSNYTANYSDYSNYTDHNNSTNSSDYYNSNYTANYTNEEYHPSPRF